MADESRINFAKNPLIFWVVSMPLFLWDIVSGETLRIFHIFSVPELARTLFAPWKRDEVSGEGLALSDRLNIMVGNMASRMVAVVIRSVTIIIGLVLTAGFYMLGLLVIAAQIFLPAVVVIFIWLGLR